MNQLLKKVLLIFVCYFTLLITLMLLNHDSPAQFVSIFDKLTQAMVDGALLFGTFGAIFFAWIGIRRIVISVWRKLTRENTVAQPESGLRPHFPSWLITEIRMPAQGSISPRKPIHFPRWLVAGIANLWPFPRWLRVGITMWVLWPLGFAIGVSFAKLYGFTFAVPLTLTFLLYYAVKKLGKSRSSEDWWFFRVAFSIATGIALHALIGVLMTLSGVEFSLNKFGISQESIGEVMFQSAIGIGLYLSVSIWFYLRPERWPAIFLAALFTSDFLLSIIKLNDSIGEQGFLIVHTLFLVVALVCVIGHVISYRKESYVATLAPKEIGTEKVEAQKPNIVPLTHQKSVPPSLQINSKEIIAFRFLLLIWGVGLLTLPYAGYSYYQEADLQNSVMDWVNREQECIKRDNDAFHQQFCADEKALGSPAWVINGLSEDRDVWEGRTTNSLYISVALLIFPTLFFYGIRWAITGRLKPLWLLRR